MSGFQNQTSYPSSTTSTAPIGQPYYDPQRGFIYIQPEAPTSFADNYQNDDENLDEIERELYGSGAYDNTTTSTAAFSGGYERDQSEIGYNDHQGNSNYRRNNSGYRSSQNNNQSHSNSDQYLMEQMEEEMREEENRVYKQTKNDNYILQQTWFPESRNCATCQGFKYASQFKDGQCPDCISNVPITTNTNTTTTTSSTTEEDKGTKP